MQYERILELDLESITFLLYCKFYTMGGKKLFPTLQILEKMNLIFQRHFRFLH